MTIYVYVSVFFTSFYERMSSYAYSHGEAGETSHMEAGMDSGLAKFFAFLNSMEVATAGEDHFSEEEDAATMEAIHRYFEQLQLQPVAPKRTGRL